MKLHIAAAIALALPVLPVGGPAEAAGAQCPQERGLRSLEGNVSTTITFANKLGRPIRIYWLDYDGRRKVYAEVQPGQRHFQQTYLTHPWVVTNNQEDCLGIYLPSPYPSQIILGD